MNWILSHEFCPLFKDDATRRTLSAPLICCRGALLPFFSLACSPTSLAEEAIFRDPEVVQGWTGQNPLGTTAFSSSF